MSGGLDDEQVERFVVDGYVRLEAAFDRETAGACVDALWRHLRIDPDDRSSWTEPVVRVPGSAAAPLVAAINAPPMVAAMDRLIGPGRWQRRLGYGTFPVRFPSKIDPGDAGWHIDGSFGSPPWYRVNLASRGRALLALMLFSDVGPDHAPTRIRVGSHLDLARAIAAQPGGTSDEGCQIVQIAEVAPAALERPVVDATGGAGDVYLCHPFLVHAASWPHRGESPRFLGQPAIHHAAGPDAGGYDVVSGPSPVEAAIRLALGVDPASASAARRSSDAPRSSTENAGTP